MVYAPRLFVECVLESYTDINHFAYIQENGFDWEFYKTSTLDFLAS